MFLNTTYQKKYQLYNDFIRFMTIGTSLAFFRGCRRHTNNADDFVGKRLFESRSLCQHAPACSFRGTFRLQEPCPRTGRTEQTAPQGAALQKVSCKYGGEIWAPLTAERRAVLKPGSPVLLAARGSMSPHVGCRSSRLPCSSAACVGTATPVGLPILDKGHSTFSASARTHHSQPLLRAQAFHTTSSPSLCLRYSLWKKYC